MSGIGHLAAGFATKPAAPNVSLLALLAASETNEIIYFLFSAVGLEEPAQMQMSFTEGVRYATQTVNPWSHGLFMSVVWSLLAAGLAYAFTKDRRSALVVGGVAMSHWLLDFLMHSNLPLFFEGSPLVGLGLENSGPGFIFMTVLDLILLGGAIALYVMYRKKAQLHGDQVK